jgi:hypothetical protein
VVSDAACDACLRLWLLKLHARFGEMVKAVILINESEGVAIAYKNVPTLKIKKFIRITA